MKHQAVETESGWLENKMRTDSYLSRLYQGIRAIYNRIAPRETRQERINVLIERERRFYKRLGERAKAEGRGNWTPRRNPLSRRDAA